MNAPFQARAGLRDPFTAFVCDDATADMLRPVAVEHGWSPEKVNKGGLRNAVQSLSVSASPNILFVDLSESADPLNDINALAEVCEPGTIVIAAGQVNDVRLYRDLVASGIHDYLLKPFTVDQLRDTFAHAQSILSGPRGEAQADKPHVMAAVDRRSRRRRRLDHRDLAGLAAGREGASLDRAARPRRPFRHRRAGARPRARPRPDRRDRESEPHRRPVHRARHGPRQRAPVGAVGRSADQPAVFFLLPGLAQLRIASGTTRTSTSPKSLANASAGKRRSSAGNTIRVSMRPAAPGQ